MSGDQNGAQISSEIIALGCFDGARAASMNWSGAKSEFLSV
jgi:hypothetical protein